jgi:uroporphyrin-III C-methyltransferase
MAMDAHLNPASGKVFLIGAGPGAADLITVRGARLLAQADAVLYDALVTGEMLALCPQAVKIDVGKRCGQKSTAQLFINRMLVNTAKQYQMVVRLKGGDPMLFGRADEELHALEQAGISYQVVPGITAALAAASAVGKPLTKRGVARSVAFFTSSTALEKPEKASSGAAEQASRAVGGPGAQSAGTGVYSNVHEDSEHRATKPSDRAAAYSGTPLPDCDTLVQYMGGREAAVTAQRLLDQGRDPLLPVIVVENCSLPNQRIHHTDLRTLQQGLPAATGPVLVMIGAALALRASEQPELLSARMVQAAARG